jgi:hypothetical protein
MNSAWANMLDQISHGLASPTWLTLPMWLFLAAAGLFAIITLVTLVRAEKSVANGALSVITLLAIGLALASSLRDFGPVAGSAGAGAVAGIQQPSAQLGAASPALSCIDEMAGETVLAACEKVLFGSAESTAAAVSYAAARISHLAAFGDVAAADRAMTPDLQALRHSIERDRYGLTAYVLLTRDHCTPIDCAAFGTLTDHNQIVANMEERTFDNLVTRYAPSWNALPVAPAAVGPLAALGGSVPTGKPTNAEFPSASSTPAVSIMNPEPGTSPATTASTPRAAAASASAAGATPPAARPAAPSRSANAAPPTPPVAPAAKKPAPKPRVPAAPVQLAPAAAADPAPAPAASSE